jgi:hypothetical protein
MYWYEDDFGAGYCDGIIRTYIDVIYHGRSDSNVGTLLGGKGAS